MTKNKNTRTDPRILRTRKLIKDAFIELLQEMDIEKITVNCLTERATINRVTFYLHYQDIPDMLEKMAEEMIEDLTAAMAKSNMNEQSSEGVNWQGLVYLLEYISAHAEFYKIVLGSKGIPIFKDRLLTWLTSRIVSGVEKRESIIEQAGIKKEILIWSHSSALIGVIISWLQNDMPYTPSFLVKQFMSIHYRTFSK
ncbi:TetR family transcriptional regulator [Shouchella clausii]|uniref:TetR/AcrR family transcriptional regulator n=1 Tax=Shouchella tritolerans TaxID=2979466 RepID=UPI0007869BC8|nr:TetR-like C-terminal domain-containing protein [Shouchella tritolerans]GIN10484.1 TetR family transcriptional regulator [Shouchella clausii]